VNVGEYFPGFSRRVDAVITSTAVQSDGSVFVAFEEEIDCKLQKNSC